MMALPLHIFMEAIPLKCCTKKDYPLSQTNSYALVYFPIKTNLHNSPMNWAHNIYESKLYLGGRMLQCTMSDE